MLLLSSYGAACAVVLVAYVAAILVSAGYLPARLRRQRMLSSDEHMRVEATLLETCCQSATDDRRYLQQFLDRYLGDARAAKQHAWVQAKMDSNYLRELIADDLNKSSDRRLVEMVEAFSLPVASDNAIDFDPEMRLARGGDIHRMLRAMSLPHYAILGGGAVVLVAMLLYPPWIRQVDEVVRIFFVQDSREVLREQFAGYHLAFAPGLPPDEVLKQGTGNLVQRKLTRNRHLITWRFLLTQLLVVTATAAIAVRLAVWRDDAARTEEEPARQ